MEGVEEENEMVKLESEGLRGDDLRKEEGRHRRDSTPPEEEEKSELERGKEEDEGIWFERGVWLQIWRREEVM